MTRLYRTTYTLATCTTEVRAEKADETVLDHIREVNLPASEAAHEAAIFNTPICTAVGSIPAMWNHPR